MNATKQDAPKSPSTDRIEKRVVLRATRARVWRALTDATEFGAWFGAKLEGPIAPGATVRGKLTIPKYEHMMLEIVVERMDKEHLFSYRWHPYANETNYDYSNEPMTLVEFRLADADGGTSLEIVESGFDSLPASRRELAFRSNEGGWTGQIKNIERHVTGS